LKILAFAEYVPAYLGSDLRFNQLLNSLSKDHEILCIVLPPLRYISGNSDTGLKNYMAMRERFSSFAHLKCKYLKCGRLVKKAWELSYSIGYIFMMLSFFIQSLACIFRHRTDVVLLAHPSYNCGLLGMICAKIAGNPIVLDYPDTWSDLTLATLGPKRIGRAKFSLLQRIESFIVTHVDQIIAISKCVAQSAIAHGAPEKKVRIIPSGINFDELPSSAQEQGLLTSDKSTHVVYSGRLEPWSDIRTLIKAFKDVVALRQDVKLTIIGDGMERNAIENMVENLGLSSNVQFLGTLERKAALARVALADLVVCTFDSTYASNAALPVKLLEYMAMGKAVISTDTETIRNFVVNGENGILCPAGNKENLAVAIITLLSDKLMRERMGELARETASKYFDLREVTLQYERVLMYV
jgi:glycosyltransferase involved in cell wall biosynthesis